MRSANGSRVSIAPWRKSKSASRPQCWKFPTFPTVVCLTGTTEEENLVHSVWGDRPQFGFEHKPHWDIGAALDILDFPRGAKIAGAQFPLFKGDGSRLLRALGSWMLDLHVQQHGYQEVWPPFVVRREVITGTGQLPKFEEDMYRTDPDDLFLVPTAEVPVTNIHRDEILDADQLPLKYTAYTPCFRREAGAAGKDTRGLLRLHQFEKVEMVKFVTPETSYDELETLRADAEEVLRQLELPYRVLELCGGELGFAATKCYDLEVWCPGIEKWQEVSSCSNFEDFQARRINVRYRPGPQARPEFVHTLNGSGSGLLRPPLRRPLGEQPASGRQRDHTGSLAPLPWRHGTAFAIRLGHGLVIPVNLRKLVDKNEVSCTGSQLLSCLVHRSFRAKRGIWSPCRMLPNRHNILDSSLRSE